MPTPIRKIEGIGEVYAEKLAQVGIVTLEALLEKGATRKGREVLAKLTGIRPDLILDWVNRADLFRIRGIGEEYSDLLAAAGVKTVMELAQRNPDNLYETLVRVNQEKKLVRRLPSRDMVRRWVEQAKALPRVVEY